MPSVGETAARRLVGEARSARLTTIDPDGRPNTVPVVFVMDGDTFYSSVDAKPKGSKDLRRMANIRRSPTGVVALIDHYEEDWEHVWWVRLRGRGRVIEDGPEHDRAHALLQEKYPQYADMPPLGDVLALDVIEWRGWSWRPIQ